MGGRSGPTRDRRPRVHPQSTASQLEGGLVAVRTR
jgi:hypothetical protein